MNKYVKAFFAIAIIGIAVQTFASKPDPEEKAFSNDWNEMKVAMEQLQAES